MAVEHSANQSSVRTQGKRLVLATFIHHSNDINDDQQINCCELTQGNGFLSCEII